MLKIELKCTRSKKCFVIRFFFSIEKRLWDYAHVQSNADCDEKLSHVVTFTLNLGRKKIHEWKITSRRFIKLALMRVLVVMRQNKHLVFSAMRVGSNESNKTRDATWWDQFSALCFLLKIDMNSKVKFVRAAQNT